MKVLLLDEAVRDLLDGWEFYEQRERGLGAYFIDSLYADLRSLAIHGGVLSSAEDREGVCRPRLPA